MDNKDILKRAVVQLDAAEQCLRRSEAEGYKPSHITYAATYFAKAETLIELLEVDLFGHYGAVGKTYRQRIARLEEQI